MELLKYNRHWEKGYRYPYPKKRDVFDVLIKAVDKRQIVELVGMRRTGKTTLLFQVINHLIDRGVDPFHIWYFTFDYERMSIDELIHNFSIKTGVDFKKERVYIFLDEIQKLPNFQSQIKVYYDIYPEVKFFLSGSTSLFIRKKSQESLAGRSIYFYLPPLNFKEFLRFKERDNLLERPSIFESEIEKEFEVFLESQFIESVFMKDKEERRNYFVSIIRKVIFEDIPSIFSVENPEVLWQIVKIVAQKPGLILDYQSLSREIGISSKTLSSYLFYLEEAFLLKRVYNFSRNLITSERKAKKFYLSSPSFVACISDFVEKGSLAENLVVSLNDYRFFWRDPYGHEVDFVDVKGEEIVPVEVKYKEVSNKELKNLVLFSRRFKSKRALLFTKTVEERTERLNGILIEVKPIYFIFNSSTC